MTTATETQIKIPAGNWQVDPVHTTAGFKVRHLELADYAGSFDSVGAELTVGADGTTKLTGYVDVESLQLDDGDLRGHLLSPEFFDAERHPRVTYEAGDVRYEGDEVIVTGKLRIKDHDGDVEVRGPVRGPVEGFDGKRHIALELSATVDRTAYGLNWQAQTADGTNVLDNAVTLEVHVELVEG